MVNFPSLPDKAMPNEASYRSLDYKTLIRLGKEYWRLIQKRQIVQALALDVQETTTHDPHLPSAGQPYRRHEGAFEYSPEVTPP